MTARSPARQPVGLVIPVRTLGMLKQPDICAYCFWLVLKCSNKFPFQIPMPGIFSSIDAYSKKLIHSYYDKQRALPPWFPRVGDVVGYVDPHLLHWNKFWHTDPVAGITVRGTPDDIFQMADGSFHIVDYKTARLTEKQDELFPAYEAQLNAYAFICHAQGMAPVSGLSLIYFEPNTKVDTSSLDESMTDVSFSLRFSAALQPVQLSQGMTPELLRVARNIYDMKSPPQSRNGCTNCALLQSLLETVS